MLKRNSLPHNGIAIFPFLFLLACLPLLAEEQASSESPEGLLAKAKSTVAKERAEAMRCLGEFRSEGVIDALVQGCRDEDYNVRAVALGSLQKTGDPKGVKVAISCLSDEVDTVRVAAVKLLGAHKTEEALSAAITACEDKGYAVRRLAVRALREIGDRRGFDIAKRMLSDNHPAVQEEACETVSALAPERAKETVWLKIYRNAEDDHVKPVALRQCARVDVQSVAKDVRAAGKSDLSQMRSVAAEGLARLGTAEDIETLYGLAVDKEAMVRLEVVDACCRLQSQDARSRILESLVVDPDYEVRLRTLKALHAHMPPEAAWIMLKTLKQEKDRGLREFAASSIRNFRNADIVPELKGILEKEEVGRVRSALEMAIADLEREDRAVRERLEGLLGKANSKVAKERVKALRGLGDFQTPTAVDALIQACQDEDYNVRAVGLDSLRKTGDPKGVKVAISCLSDPVDIVRLAAVRVLGVHKTEEALSAAITSCGDKDRDVRRFALRSIREIGDKKALDVARRMLSDRSVQHEACETISAFVPDKEAAWLEIYRNAKEDHVKLAALRQCVRVNVQSVAKDVRDAAKSELVEMRAVAAEGLARLGTPEDIETLAGMAGDKDTEVPLALVDACLFLEGQDARCRILGSLVVDPRDAVRLKTLEYLALRRPPETVPLLLKNLKQEKVVTFRTLAAGTVGRFGNKENVQDLKALLEKEEVEKVRSALERAIANLERGNGKAPAP